MRINCVYHADQPITNFCRDTYCLMPLCPECIAQHTLHHEAQKTRPQYATIHQVQADVHAQLTHAIESLESDKKRNANLMVNIKTVGEKVRARVMAAKQMVYQAVEESFAVLERDINKQLDRFHEQKSIYSLAKAERQDKQLLGYLDELTNIRNTLKTQRGLSNIIHYLRDMHSQAEAFHSQFAMYLHHNENYTPKIDINNDALMSLDSIITRVVKIGAPPTLPPTKRRYEQESTSSRSPIRYVDTQHNHSRIKERNGGQLLQSQVNVYSPMKSKLGGGKAKGGVDQEYEKLSRKVAVMRQENEKLSRLLRTTENRRI